jgi:tRNA threonylcarbamoyladenosine biosynthesis protein TsaE
MTIILGVTQNIANEFDMKSLGQLLGAACRGGECIELIGDVGAGKTTFMKGVAAGLEVDEEVQSPSFTLSREYEARDGLRLSHYDFYRLDDPGVLSYELAESLAEPHTITAIEWADTVEDVLPPHHITVTIAYHAHDNGRTVDITLPEHQTYIKKALS